MGARRPKTLVMALSCRLTFGSDEARTNSLSAGGMSACGALSGRKHDIMLQAGEDRTTTWSIFPEARSLDLDSAGIRLQPPSCEWRSRDPPRAALYPVR